MLLLECFRLGRQLSDSRSHLLLLLQLVVSFNLGIFVLNCVLHLVLIPHGLLLHLLRILLLLVLVDLLWDHAFLFELLLLRPLLLVLASLLEEHLLVGQEHLELLFVEPVKELLAQEGDVVWSESCQFGEL